MTHQNQRIRRMRRPLFGAFALLTAASLGVTGCAGTDADGGSSAQTSELVFGLSGDVPTMTAGLNQGGIGILVNSVIHRGLLSYDADGELVPALAESYEMIDPKTYSFTLRDGLTFHDGTPITSETVRASLKHFAQPETSASGYVAFHHIESIEIIDDLNLTVTLDADNLSFTDYLADPNHAIFPESALNSETDNLIGAGPFKVVEENDGLSLELNSFDGYYDADAVGLDEVTLAAYPDGSARVNALQSGDVDIIEYVPWESFSTIESNPDLVLESTPAHMQEVMFNVSDGPLADPQVRQAIAYAIDREALAANVFEGNAEPLYGVAVSEGSAYDIPAANEMYSYDPDKARALLAEAGYPDGFDVTITATSTYSFVQDTGLSVQQSLSDIGINATMETPDWPTFIERANSGDYEIAISGGSGYVRGPEYLASFVSGPGNLIRSFGYENAELDSALQDGMQAADENARVKAFEEAFEIIAEDTPVVFPAQRAQAYAYSSDIGGFKNLPGFLTLYSGYTLAETTIN